MDKKTDLEVLKYNGLSNAYKELGVSYLGNVNHSSKLSKGSKINLLTYGVYLASSNLSGFQACTHDKQCRVHCLMGSGRSMIEQLSGKNRLVNSRVLKTRLYFLNREYFSQMVFAEIQKHSLLAKLDNSIFAVRLNCTSDLPLERISLDGVNVLQKFSDVVFYDYTKNPKNLSLVKKYKNYHLTFSFDGVNWDSCIEALKKKINVAVVFEKLPKKFNGFEVINGDENDYRPADKKGVIVGLKFKMTKNSINNKKFTLPQIPFIVTANDSRCEW